MEKFSEKLKKLFSSDASLKRIPLYFFFTCVLLIVLIFKLGETNLYLKEIAANGTNAIEINTKDDDYESVVDIFIETTKSADDYIPLLEEMTSQETTTKNNENITNETSTKPTNTQINDENSEKTTYVVNISSKKIHLPECSFVNRTKDENKKTVELTDQELNEYLNNGYTLCKTCGGD